MKKHYEVVSAIFIENDKVFCCKRKNGGECSLKWEFPGGKIELGETKEQALKREIREELDAEIEINRYLNTIKYEYKTFILTMHNYLCSFKTNYRLVEHTDCAFCTIEQMKKMDFAEADFQMFDLIEETIKNIK